jgi:AcrR family transcriptional regulator
MGDSSVDTGPGGWEPEPIVDLTDASGATTPIRTAPRPAASATDATEVADTADIRDGSEVLAVDQPVDTRERLVRAAAEVFREKGYTGTRVVDIARRAGFTSGALYAHFDNRSELLAEALAVENARRIDAISEQLASRDAAAVTEAAAALAGLVAMPTASADELLMDGLAISSREPRVRQRLGESLAGLAEAVESRLACRPARAGSHLDDRPDVVAYLAVLMILGSTSVRVVGLQHLVPPELEGVLAEVLGALGFEDGAAN